MNNTKCRYCGGANISIVNMYKDKWLCCHECGIAQSHHKEKYFFSFLPASLIKFWPKLKRLVPDSAIISEGSKVYDSMATDEHVQNHIKQRFVERFVDEVVKRHDIDLAGKRVLDISGGNGYFAKRLADLGASVILTEYNMNSVNYARKHFNIRAERYDLNSDLLSELFQSEKFDIVLMRWSVMFCLDLPRFLVDIKKIMPTDGMVIVQSILPTLGTMLKYQWHDYNLLVLYPLTRLTDNFRDQGFDVFAHAEKSKGYLYNADLSAQHKGKLGTGEKVFDLLHEIPARMTLPDSSPFRSLLIESETIIYHKDKTDVSS